MSDDIVERLRAKEGVSHDEAANEIESLRQQLADMQKQDESTVLSLELEIERLRQQLADTTWQDHADHWQKRAVKAEQQLAECQAREKVLRDALEIDNAKESR